jgi:DNA-binding winged helix-turn-helix (wHTH) protein/tetratricopeptide (TPR) repeat protein
VLSEVKSFGSFRLDTANHCLWRDAERVSITPKAYDVLCHLVQNSGRLVTPDEMLGAIWADTYVNPEVLRKYILEIRKALGDKPDAPQFVETIPKRGYRFIAPVCDDSEPASSDAAETIPSSTAEVTPPQSAVDDRHLALPWNGGATTFTRSGKFWRVAALLAAVILAVLVFGTYRRSTRAVGLTDKDTVVLADFANATGDPVFDDTLKTALSISLNQSPFLNVVSDNKVAATLKQMMRPPETKLTPDVARELCQRARSKAYIAGSIVSLGSLYVLGLKAVNCQSGDMLAQEQATAAAKEKVLDGLGEATSKLRSELGESLATIQKFDGPLAEATTSSLEALKAFTLGGRAANEKGPAAALPYDQRAIELDPNFALGYSDLGNDYYNLGETSRASQNFARAFQLREHASGWERLQITADYYLNVTGELDKAGQTFQEQIDSYPRRATPYAELGLVFAEQGQHEKAVEVTKQGLRLAPDSVFYYANLANYTLALQRFDETRRIIHEAQARKLEELLLHSSLYAVAFAGSDSPSMAEQQQWFAGKPEEDFGLSLASDTEAYGGRRGKARELTRRAVGSAVRAGRKENAAIWQAIAAQREAAYGYTAEARQLAAEALILAPTSQGTQAEVALAFAMAGDAARAESLTRDLGKRYPLDMQMQALWRPPIQAQLALNKGSSPGSALTVLQAASPIEFGLIQFVANGSCLYPTYIRGEAYLAARQGTQAAVEFQKILDHSGIVWNCWTGALAHLGVARANALQLKAAQGANADPARARALAAYKDFLSLWKDADADIPILKQAKAEYAKLQ